MKKIPKMIAAMVISYGVTGLAVAATPGAYVGGGLGLGVIKSSNLSTDQMKNVVSGKVAAGFNFNKNFGLEADYAMYSKASWDSNPLSLDLNLNAFTLLGKGYIPLAKDSPWDVYGLLGVAYMMENVNAKYYSTSIASDSRNAFVLAGGGGISRQLNKHFRASLESVVTDDKKGNIAHLDIPQTVLTTVNLHYTFD